MTTHPGPEQDDDESYTTAENQEQTLEETQSMEMGVSIRGNNNKRGHVEDTVTLPESTYSFLFTEPTRSIPGMFSWGIAAMSCTCLTLALINNITCEEVPASVNTSVRIAQYLAILIALLMEEEIPTGLYLLRRISKPHLKSKFPEIKYWKFVCSSTLRIAMGYLFLGNVLVILIQADEVLTIFYDVLALQFLQQLDDIAFRVAKIDVLGKRLHRATMMPYFNAEFQKQKNGNGSRTIKYFLKAIYFINLAVFLAAMIVISVRQTRGHYQCESITVTFGEEVWREAIVLWPDDSKSETPGTYEQLALVYSSFNGVYIKDKSRTHEGRPVYIEQKKYDRTPFDVVAPLYYPYNYPIYHDTSGEVDPVKPAEIKYCGGSWVFSHDDIRKSKKNKSEKCPWLLRSPGTASYDLLDVDGRWNIWTGAIFQTEVSIKCNECLDDSDCNLNGVCNKSNGECECDADEDAVYLGGHCEVKLRNECRTIIGELYNETWTVGAVTLKDTGRMGSSEVIDQEYSRPVYSYVDGLPEDQAPRENASFSLLYSGSRWSRINLPRINDETAAEYWKWQTSNYHGESR